MPNSPSQIIPYMLEWRQIWGSARQRKGSNSAKAVYQEIPLVYLAKARLRCSPRVPHTNTIGITAEIESEFVAKDDLAPFRCSPVSFCAAPLQTEASIVKESTGAVICATCHTPRATIDLLKDTFGDRLISRFGPVNWPPRSCDLTPLDYFLWGYVKSLVYADKAQTLDHLEDNIRRVIADIRPQMLEKVIENWTSRLDYIRASRGSHMPEIIFKM
ncbi:hypothetical protein TNCV_299811 [Trichonephila clavipes]|nr:hypothetical protein TNCV_299811 [Trichonephila clavipes]